MPCLQHAQDYLVVWCSVKTWFYSSPTNFTTCW